MSLGCPALACMTCRARVVDRRRRGIAAQLVNRLARQGGFFLRIAMLFYRGFRANISTFFFCYLALRGRRGGDAVARGDPGSPAAAMACGFSDRFLLPTFSVTFPQRANVAGSQSHG